MLAGIYLLISPMISSLSWIPLIEYLNSHGIGFEVLIFAIILSLTITFSLIAVSWVYYRPLYGMIFIGFTFVGLTLMFARPQ